MKNVDLTNRLQYIFLADNLSWEDFAERVGEKNTRLRSELMTLLEETNEILSHIGYHIEIVKDPERIR